MGKTGPVIYNILIEMGITEGHPTLSTKVLDVKQSSFNLVPDRSGTSHSQYLGYRKKSQRESAFRDLRLCSFWWLPPPALIVARLELPM